MSHAADVVSRRRWPRVTDRRRSTTTVGRSRRSPELIAAPPELGEPPTPHETKLLPHSRQHAILDLNARQVATECNRHTFSRDIVRNSDPPIWLDHDLVARRRGPHLVTPRGTRNLDRQRPTIRSRRATVVIAGHAITPALAARI